MNKKILLLLVTFVSVLRASLVSSYDHARMAFDRGNFSQAQKHLDESLVEDPFNAQKLYDAGVIAYKQDNFSQAIEYFQQARSVAKRPGDLEEHSLFNHARAHAQLNQLQHAIDVYEELLQEYPGNDKARHNLEILKKMLEEQKQKEEQQKEKNKQKDQSQEQKNNDDQQKNDQNKQDTSDQSESNQQKTGDQNDQADDRKSGEQQQDDQSGSERDDDSEKGREGVDEESNAHNENGEQQNRSEPEGNNDEASQQKQEKEDAHQTDKKEVEQQAGLEKLDSALAAYIQEHDKRDAELNKQLIQLMVGQQKRRNNHAPEW